MEQAFQGLLLKDFRVKLRDLTQSDLANEIQEIIEDRIEKEEQKDRSNWFKLYQLYHFPSSAATISRLENSRIYVKKAFKTPENQRRKGLNVPYAKIIAQALNIQVGHFFSSFFASRLAF